MKISKGQRYVDIQNQTVIEILGTDDTGHCTVATVQGDGRLVRRRTVLDTNIHPNPLTKGGAPWQRGYIPVSAWKKQTKEKNVSELDDNVNLSDLTTDALAEYVARKEAMAKRLSEQADAAKKILKTRTCERGTKIFGETAVIAKPNRRFNDDYARTRLTPDQYKSICIQKADPVVAKRVLGEDSEAYAKCLKDSGWSLTVRPATDDDYEAVRRAEEAQNTVEEMVILETGV